MYELWKWSYEEKSFVLAGQYPTRKAAVAIGRDYLARGFRCQVRSGDRVVWESGYNPRCAT